MTVEELTCRELVEIVTDYLEGALSPEDFARFERHLSVCEGCTIYVDQMRETIRLTGMLREDQIPENAREALLNAFRGWKSAASRDDV
jgi:anti-sigma factor RsiW